MVEQPTLGLGRLIVEVSRWHKLDTHKHPVRLPLYEWSARRGGRYLHNTQRTQKTNIYAVSGIRTRDPSNRTAADQCFRQHGHKNWLNCTSNTVYDGHFKSSVRPRFLVTFWRLEKQKYFHFFLRSPTSEKAWLLLKGTRPRPFVLLLTHWGRGHLNCLNARSRGF